MRRFVRRDRSEALTLNDLDVASSMAWSAADIPDQSGRVAVVTGANGGFGLEVSRELTCLFAAAYPDRTRG
jgi:hypothetical protein